MKKYTYVFLVLLAGFVMGACDGSTSNGGNSGDRFATCRDFTGAECEGAGGDCGGNPDDCNPGNCTCDPGNAGECGGDCVNGTCNTPLSCNDEGYCDLDGGLCD